MKSFIKRNKYLMRLISTTALFAFIPFLIVFLIIIQRISANLYNTQYNMIADSSNILRSIFEQEISSAYDLAVKMSVDSKTIRNNSSVLQPAVFSQNEYYYSECVDVIFKYSANNQRLVGLYYPSEDVLFTKYSKFDSASFVNIKLNITDDIQASKLYSLLSNSKNSLNFCTIFKEENQSMFFLAIPIEIGLGKSKAIVLFELSQDIFSNSVIQAYGVKNIGFSVFSNNYTNLVFSTNSALPYKDISFSKLGLQNTAFNDYKIFTNSNFTAHLLNSDVYQFQYFTVMSTDKIVQHVQESILFFIILMIIFMLLLGVLLTTMVHINYSPIKKISKLLTKNRTEDEISAITNTLDNLITEASEKNLLIMDFLLGNLLYGLPINDEQCEQLGILNKANYYAIITIYGQPINTQKRNQFIEYFMKNYKIQFFITDILYKNHSVAICMMPHQEIDKVSHYLLQELSDTNNIYVGSTVHNLDKIQQSYRDCLRQHKANQNGISNHVLDCSSKNNNIVALPPQNTSETFCEIITEYVTKNCNNPLLSQVMVADNFGISIYSLSRLFNNEIGIGFTDYVSALRLELAKKLLLTTQKSISEISNEVGIQNVNYFSRWFKTHSNLTPSQFRSKEEMRN